MKIRIPGNNGPGIFLCGILKGVNYDPQKRHIEQRVSFSLFMTWVRRAVESLSFSGDRDGALRNVNNFLHTMIRTAGFRLDSNIPIMEYRDGSLIGAIPIVSGNKEMVETVAFRFSYLVSEDNGHTIELEVDINSPEKVRYEALILMQWIHLHKEVCDYLVEIDGHCIKMGLMLAAKLYELHGDVAGKMATIDEAYDGH